MACVGREVSHCVASVCGIFGVKLSAFFVNVEQFTIEPIKSKTNEERTRDKRVGERQRQRFISEKARDEAKGARKKANKSASSNSRRMAITGKSVVRTLNRRF